MEICRLILPIDPGPMSPNKRTNWRKLAKLKSDAWKAARWIWLEAGKPKSDVPIRVSYIVRRARRLDDDNAILGLKSARDALFNDAITPNDTPDWVLTAGLDQEIGPQWKARPETVVIVEAR